MEAEGSRVVSLPEWFPPQVEGGAEDGWRNRVEHMLPASPLSRLPVPFHHSKQGDREWLLDWIIN